MISRLLLLRSTRTTRALARDLSETFDAAYPARPDDVMHALTRADEPWPGAGILWVAVDGETATVLERRPPGLARRPARSASPQPGR